MTDIHATAIVSPDAHLHESVTVGAYAIIDADVSIGEGTVIGPHCVVRGTTVIGKNNRIFQFCSIGEDPQDKKYAGEPSRLVIGDGNTIREYCTLNRGTADGGGVTSLGNNNWLMAYVHVAHDCFVGNETIFANNATLGGHVRVDDYVIFGGFAGVHQFCKVGAHAFVAMFSGVNRDIPPYLMAAGQPAVPRGINSEGLKRRGFDATQMRNIKEAFRVLYRSGLQMSEARDRIKASVVEKPELGIVADFLDSTERSIIR